MKRLIVIVCMMYPLSIITGPAILSLSASLCAIGNAMEEPLRHAIYDIDAQGTATPHDSSDAQHIIKIQECTLCNRDNYAIINYSLPTHCATTTKTVDLLYDMQNIIKEYPADNQKYLRFSLIIIKQVITPRSTKRVTFALSGAEDVSLTTNDQK